MGMPQNLLGRILEYTSRQMETPVMFGKFHIIAVLAAVILAAAGAAAAKRLTDAGRIGLLTVCGWILVLMEIYKQLFLYYVVNDWVYDWWYFPFQLCSVPMYLCILLPFLCSEGRDRFGILTFLASYTFLGAAAALAMPEDFLKPYAALTLHGFIWHGLLLFISFTIIFSGMAELSLKGFAKATVLFALLCAAAVAVNIAAEPVMASAHADGLLPEMYAAMFYLNPYHISPQPLVDTVQETFGITTGLVLYVLVIIIAAGLICLLLRHLSSGRTDK